MTGEREIAKEANATATGATATEATATAATETATGATAATSRANALGHAIASDAGRAPEIADTDNVTPMPNLLNANGFEVS